MMQRKTWNRRFVRRMALGLTAVAVAAAAGPTAGAGTTAPQAQLPTLEELQQFSFTPGTPQAQLPTLEELQKFSFQPGTPQAQLPSLAELQKFSFQPSGEPVGPIVAPSDPVDYLPSLAELQQFRFQPSRVTPTASPVSGIDWADAGIGAGIAVGTLLIGAAAAFGLRRHRRLAHS